MEELFVPRMDHSCFLEERTAPEWGDQIYPAPSFRQQELHRWWVTDAQSVWAHLSVKPSTNEHRCPPIPVRVVMKLATALIFFPSTHLEVRVKLCVQNSSHFMLTGSAYYPTGTVNSWRPSGYCEKWWAKPWVQNQDSLISKLPSICKEVLHRGGQAIIPNFRSEKKWKRAKKKSPSSWGRTHG